MKRREFLSTSAAAVLGTTVIPSKRERGALPKVPVRLGTVETRLTESVYKERIARAQELMKVHSIDALFVAPSTNLSYLLGRKLWRSERLIAVIVPQSGEPDAICPAFERSVVERGLAFREIHVWEEHENPYALVGRILRPKSAGESVTVALEPTTYFETYENLKKELPEARMLNGTAVFDELRIVKSPLEVELIREAVKITEESISAVHESLREGITELEVAALLGQEIEKRGSSGGGLVQFGPNSAIPHGEPGRTKLKKESAVLIDSGSRVEGYASDITRTIFWGDVVTREYRKVFAAVLEAQQAAVDLAKPGVPCQDLDRVARAVISKAGYGQYFIHRLGHGMGMDGHEPPYLVEGNTRPLERGNVVTIEPGIYLPGKFGVRIEDDFVLTEHGIESLSTRVEMP